MVIIRAYAEGLQLSSDEEFEISKLFKTFYKLLELLLKLLRRLRYTEKYIKKKKERVK